MNLDSTIAAIALLDSVMQEHKLYCQPTPIFRFVNNAKKHLEGQLEAYLRGTV